MSPIPDHAPSPSHHLSPGIIAAIVIASIVGALFLAACGTFCAMFVWCLFCFNPCGTNKMRARQRRYRQRTVNVYQIRHWWEIDSELAARHNLGGLGGLGGQLPQPPPGVATVVVDLEKDARDVETVSYRSSVAPDEVCIEVGGDGLHPPPPPYSVSRES